MSKPNYQFPIIVLRAVESERRYQEGKWPQHQHSVPEWLTIIEIQIQKAKRAWYEGHGDDSKAMQEVRKLTACGFAAMEQLGAIPRE